MKNGEELSGLGDIIHIWILWLGAGMDLITG